MGFTLFAVLSIIVCVLLVIIILVQNPKGGGLSSTFGGSSQIIGSVAQTNSFLDKTTWTLAGLLTVLCLLSVLSLPKESSTYDELLDGGASTKAATEMPVMAPPVLSEQAPAQDTAR